MREDQTGRKHIRSIYITAARILYRLVGRRDRIDAFMKDRASPVKIALLASTAAGIIMTVMLFIPPYKGVADDGSLYKVMRRSGLVYIETEPGDIYNNYFIRQYRLENASPGERKLKSSQDLFIRGAILLDIFFTRDQYFDIRFLAFLYCLLYLPAVYLTVKYACSRMTCFSESAAAAALAVFIFADISFVSYFNSLYPEALWMICSLYCSAAVLGMQDQKNGFLNLVLLGVSGSLLCLSRKQCGVIGFILAGFCIAAIFYYRSIRWKAGCMLLSFLLSLTAVIAGCSLEEDFDLTSKYHAMTRGVLFEAPNPETALKELGINPSYAVLAKTSAYNPYPFAKVESEQLQKGFYDQYRTRDIVIYYIKHPVRFLRMLDVAVKNTSMLRRSFCGNYEKSAGFPKMAQGLFWSGWSNFKARFAPGTVGYLLILNAAAFLPGRRRRSCNTIMKKEKVNPLSAFSVMITFTGLSQAAISIVRSGDAELDRHAFLLGASLDLLFFFIVARWIPGLKIFRLEDKKVVEAK